MTKITNMSAEPMPVAIGFHPITSSPILPARNGRDGARENAVAAQHRKVPTGETEPADKFFPNGQGQLRTTTWTMCSAISPEMRRDART